MLFKSIKQIINRLSLKKEQLDFWKENGYVVLPKLFSSIETQNIRKLVDQILKNKKTNEKTVIDIYVSSQSKRIYLKDCPDDAELESFKINDLYLEHELICQAALKPLLTKYLREFLHGDPMLCNSLNFKYGSQQWFHNDSLYMTPPKDFNLAAAWIALEDCHPDAGPLQYYPGSHLIPPYLFSNGVMSSIPEEMGAFQEYMQSEIDKRGLQVQQFLPKEGDCLIWHSQLFHGGGKIINPELTRKSLVTHYFRNGDYPCKTADLGGGRHWMVRETQKIDQ
jgi:ectoine hydroxylase-related dioxygenase (phytanoyl-CoA dioxygenase family)